MSDSHAFSWIEHLPPDEQAEFRNELLTFTLASNEAAYTPEEWAKGARAIFASWKSTAEIYADPELREILTSDAGFNPDDFVEAPRPSETAREENE